MVEHLRAYMSGSRVIKAQGSEGLMTNIMIRDLLDVCGVGGQVMYTTWYVSELGFTHKTT